MTAAAADSMPPRRWLLPSLAALIAAALLLATFLGVRQNVGERLTLQAQTSAEANVQTLESILSTQRAVAGILADDTLVLATLTDPTDPNRDAVSRKLDRLRDLTQSAVIYLLDSEGVAIAASNWDEPVSFVGQDYSFRDYFTGAVQQGTALQFALGTVSHRPGLYLSHAVTGPAGIAGVVVVKVEFDMLEASWASGTDHVFVTDAAGMVLLSGSPAFRFAALPPVARDQISASATLPGPGWVLTTRRSATPALQSAALATGTTGFVLAMVGYGFGRLRQARRRDQRRTQAEQRYRADLEQAVEARTHDLSQEMRERQAAEVRLARMQADLVQANKLAALGQITAGVAHEINQPLATIRLLAENGLALMPRDGPAEVSGNLGSIVRMSDRIGRITAELRGFARKATGRIEAVSLTEAIDASLLLAASRSRNQKIRIDVARIAPDLRVVAEQVRLEQILVNLVQNGQEALVGRPDPWIRIEASVAEDTVTVRVEDNGPGVAPEIAASLFTPFSTSKPDGLGLGLVIAQDIARDFGGDLKLALPDPAKGATFLLTLRAAP